MTIDTTHIIECLTAGQHIVLTGSRRVGKTTLFNHLIEQLPHITVVQSRFDRDDVNLYYRDDVYRIGRRQKPVMQVMPAGFDLAKRAVSDSLRGSSTILAIDEIGFLELWRQDYIDDIVHASQQLTLLLVLRKGNHALRYRLADLDRYDRIDLDESVIRYRYK